MQGILIGVDESEHAQDAVAFGAQIARVSGAPVVVASALAPRRSPADAERAAKALCERIGVTHASVRVISCLSPPVALRRLARSEHAALVIVGSAHPAALGDWTRGRTGERLPHGSPCAIAAVPPGYRERAQEAIGRVGVGYDASGEAEAAVGAAIELARAFRAAIDLIGVVSGDVQRVSPPAQLRRWDGYALAAQLDSVGAGIPPDVQAGIVLLEGDPAQRLAEYSRQLDALVVGSRGYRPLRAVPSGSVSRHLTRSAHCPVIVVPPAIETQLGILFHWPAAPPA